MPIADEDLALRRIARELRRLAARRQQTTSMRFGLRSDLAHDDARYADVALSQTVALALGSAADQLELLRHLGLSLRAFSYAAFSLLRVAAEAAGTVIWLLESDSSDVRVGRHLALQLKQLVNYLKLNEDLPGASMSDGAVRADFVREGRARIARTASNEKVRTAGPGFNASATEILKVASEYLVARHPAGEPNRTMVFRQVWRITSGFAHGQDWARELYLGNSTGLFSVHNQQPMMTVQSSAVKAEPFFGRVVYMVEAAFELFDQRGLDPAT